MKKAKKTEIKILLIKHFANRGYENASLSFLREVIPDFAANNVDDLDDSESSANSVVQEKQFCTPDQVYEPKELIA